MVGIGDAVLHQGIDAGKDIQARSGNKMRGYSQHKRVAIPARSAIVGPEDEPAIRRRQRRPLVPVGTEAVAVGVGRAAVNQCQHPQVFRALLAGRINQDSFHVQSIRRLPAVRLPFHLRSIAENRIQRSHCLCRVHHSRTLGDEHLRRFLDRRVSECNSASAKCGMQVAIVAGERADGSELWSIDSIQKLVDARESGGQQRAVRCHRDVFPRSVEVAAQSRQLAASQVI